MFLQCGNLFNTCTKLENNWGKKQLYINIESVSVIMIWLLHTFLLFWYTLLDHSKSSSVISHISFKSPPATSVCVCLQDYKLNFGLWEENVENAWHGGVATIESCPGTEVWGVIWTLSNENLTSLDKWDTQRH